LTTDINGNYKITNVMPGTYVVSENAQTGWKQTFPVAPGTYVITITDAGEQFGDIKLCNTNTGSIAGMNSTTLMKWSLKMKVNLDLQAGQ